MSIFTKTVGVAPGTTTINLGRRWDPYQDPIALSDVAPIPIDLIARFDRPLRWDLIGVVGGGALLVALAAGFIASALQSK